MQSKGRAALIVLLAAALMNVAANLSAPLPPQIDDVELMPKLCGKLEHVDRIPNQSVAGGFTEKYRAIKDAKLVAYERHSNSECCASAPVAAELTTGKSGSFEFKGLMRGYYWLVAKVEKQEYQMAIRIAQLQDKQPVCSQMSFAIDESGKFILRIRVPGR